ncbi:MAG TPA: phosphate regulon sensor histidine kinase PhoR [Burkholderiaceae bacterium]|nr:phosphate regulon sensor histidine kinase PhoR [Burkholderiaceae bacterium]
MIWLLPRLLTALAVAAVAALIGHLAAAMLRLPTTGWAIAGALLGLVLVATRDALRAGHLMAWLRGSQAADAPRDTGFWGELGYRMERALRSREQALQRERQRTAQFLSAIEASPNGVMLLDAGDRIEWCNSTAADHLGVDPQRDIGQPLTNLVRVPTFVAHLQARKSDEPLTFSIPARRGALAVWVRPYGDGQVLLITQDITERLRTDEMRRDFVANASHEIRTPLTVLAGFVDTMNQIELTPAEQHRVLGLMKEQTDRMRVLLDDLLTLAQLEGGPRPPVDHWIDVDALLRRVQADAQSLSVGRHEIVFEGSGGAVAGNEAELYGALLNLVSNAVRYTPAGGRITVSWQRRAQGAGVFEVRDTGIGIAREHLPRLGERFYRVDDGRSRSTGGTGLGLAIAKHAVQRHGGELSVDSEPGKGSTFRLMLPASRVR